MEKELKELLKLKENVVRWNMCAELDERLGVDPTKSNESALFYEPSCLGAVSSRLFFTFFALAFN